MAELLDLVVLHRVVERASFARAAADFGVPPSTMSRKVAALEIDLMRDYVSARTDMFDAVVPRTT